MDDLRRCHRRLAFIVQQIYLDGVLRMFEKAAETFVVHVPYGEMDAGVAATIEKIWRCSRSKKFVHHVDLTGDRRQMERCLKEIINATL